MENSRSVKKFLGLPLDKPSPDHPTFSRLRSRISKAAGPEGPLARRDALIAHVRICGGWGKATSLVYPTNGERSGL